MPTNSLPYRCSPEDQALSDGCRRVCHAAAVRMSFARDLNRTLQSWGRNPLIAMPCRKANLAGIAVVEARGVYPTMIGNWAFKVPEARVSFAINIRSRIAARATVECLILVLNNSEYASVSQSDIDR